MRRVLGSPLVRGGVAIGLAWLLAAALPGVDGRTTSSSPPLPLALDRQFLGNLSTATVAPGQSTSLGYSLTDPAGLGSAITTVVLAFQVYAFNGYPGDASAQLPVANAPVLSNATASGPRVTVAIGSLSRGATVRGSIGVATSSDTPAGTFAIRTSLAFAVGSTSYLLESRGYFSAAVWASATELPNGSATLNLSRLGVSGVIPETALLVASSDWTWALGALLAGAFGLLAVGAWVYWRRGPGSTSGTA